MTYPDSATVLFKLVDRPDFTSDSLEMEVAIFSDAHQRLAARCVESTVIYDYRKAKKASLPGYMVEKFQETYDKQLEAKRRHYQQAREVIRAVDALENAGSG